jgi:hypothetical protein
MSELFLFLMNRCRAALFILVSAAAASLGIVALILESLPSIHCLYQYNHTIQEHTGETEPGKIHLYSGCPAGSFFGS